MSIYYGKYNILNVLISACDPEYVLSSITQSIKKKSSLVIAPVASHPVVFSLFDIDYQRILNSFDLVISDSFYLTYSLRLLYQIKIKNRVYGPDLFIKICKFCEEKNYKILLFGNDAFTVKKKLHADFPSLRIDCLGATGKLVADKELYLLKRMIKKTDPELIFIGIGSPKQHFVAYNLLKVNKPIVAVGAAFSFVSGRIPQAPSWVGKLGFEWLFRLLKEPKRLWKRYLIFG